MNKRSNLLLIHGLLGSLDFFQPNELMPNINVMSPDLFGYGDVKTKANLSLQDQVNFIKTFVDENGNAPFWLLGHSVGGAIANLFAYQCPELVQGIINVEGNFTLKDAFWCQSIAKKDPAIWELEYKNISSQPEKWLTESNIALSPQRIAWAQNILSYQKAENIQAVAKAVVHETDSEHYKTIVNHVSESNMPVYLLAGERSVNSWDVPKRVRKTAKALHIIDNTGHMMMLEKPEIFCTLVEKIILHT